MLYEPEAIGPAPRWEYVEKSYCLIIIMASAVFAISAVNQKRPGKRYDICEYML